MNAKKPSSSKQPATSTKVGSMTRNGDDDVTAEVQLDPNNPIPLELENVYGFSPGGSKFIPFFGGDDSIYGKNAFFINILRARLESNTQNACIVSKSAYTIGDGVYIDGADREGKNDKVWTDFKKRANVDGKSFNAVLEAVINDYYNFGNVCVEIVKGEIGGKRFLFVYSKNILDCRKSWPDENNTSNAVIISRYFRKPGVWNLTQRYNIRIPFYRSGPGTKAKYWLQDSMAKPDPEQDGGGISGSAPKGLKVWRTAIWIKKEFPGYDHYGLPSWLTSIIFGKLQFEGAHYNIDNLTNNMNPGGVLNMPGSLTDKELNEQSRKINKQYTGKGKRGRIIVTQGEEGKVSYTPFPTEKEGSYLNTNRLSREEIVTANEWDLALIGVGENGTMGKGGSYMKELYQNKIKTVIKPVHRKIKDEFLTPLCEIADEWLGTQWSSYNLDIAISNLFDDQTEATTTVAGITAFIEIVKMVSTGSWPLDAAIKFVAERFAMSEQEAKEKLGAIKVTTPTATTKPDNV